MKVVKKYNLFRPFILSRHPSHNVLRSKTKNIKLLPFKSVVRLGSTTSLPDDNERIQINTIEAIKNSANKLLMKQKFTEAGVKTALWCKGVDLQIPEVLNYPIVLKSHFGSKGKGNTLIKNAEELEKWEQSRSMNGYIVESFMNYAHEFRLHITEDGCFYACRKALKKDIPQEEKWHFHDDTCVWFLEDNESFFKPNSWEDIISDCVKALKAIGADVLSFDVKVQSSKKQNGELREYQDYILLECNSASSMDNGTGNLSVCAQKYIEEIPKIIIKKGNKK